MAHFRVFWRRQRKAQRLPELNNYPQTPQAYYEGYYPGSAAVKANRVEFKREHQKLPELNTYPVVSVDPYPAFIEIGHHRVSFKRVIQHVPELNTYPETPPAITEPITAWLTHFEPTRNNTNRRHQKELEKPYTPNYGFYPAFILEAANRATFKRTRQELPELNQYPETPASYYSGFYPGSALAKANRIWFRRTRQDVELNEYPKTITSVPTVPGLEYTLPDDKLHYDIPNNKLHYTIKGDGVGTAPQRQPASVGAERNTAFSYSSDLDEGELLTGTPLVTEGTTTDLTITNKSVSTEILIINGKSVPIGEAVQCHITGFVSANFPYTLNVIVVTDATPPQTLPGKIIIEESL